MFEGLSKGPSEASLHFGSLTLNLKLNILRINFSRVRIFQPSSAIFFGSHIHTYFNILI